MKLLEGKKAVVTGGSEGIGFAIVEAFLKNGAEVLIISRSQKKLDFASEKLLVYKNKVHTLSFDLSNLREISNLVQEINVMFYQVDILVNNAAMGLFKKIEDIEPIELENTLRLNVQSPYILTQQLLPSLVRARGNVINMSSYFSNKMIYGRYSTAYSITKGAIDSFTKSLASELGSKGIRVNAIAPGSVKTSLFNIAIDKMDEEKRKNFLMDIKKLYPLERIGKPDDLGGIAVFLASDMATWITGSITNVDGGLTVN
ncbi:SDR family NAD(P)-dependent oxidoreductase [Maribacter litoralis]|uniref:SDR family NAD(P)-dependent oxidoreductase n=1 Tax=Maribacter litoralis TaxID=2059726 RepID=UPI003F5CD3E8